MYAPEYDLYADDHEAEGRKYKAEWNKWIEEHDW
jgi:hypothetical protein